MRYITLFVFVAMVGCDTTVDSNPEQEVEIDSHIPSISDISGTYSLVRELPESTIDTRELKIDYVSSDSITVILDVNQSNESRVEVSQTLFNGRHGTELIWLRPVDNDFYHQCWILPDVWEATDWIVFSCGNYMDVMSVPSVFRRRVKG